MQEAELELLLSQPEILAWLELSELDVRSWLELLPETKDEDQPLPARSEPSAGFLVHTARAAGGKGRLPGPDGG